MAGDQLAPIISLVVLTGVFLAIVMLWETLLHIQCLEGPFNNVSINYSCHSIFEFLPERVLKSFPVNLAFSGISTIAHFVNLETEHEFLCWPVGSSKGKPALCFPKGFASGACYLFVPQPSVAY